MVAVLVLACTGLLRDLREPWVGMHDWNGAFFSQLARNVLRYPFSMHHGMPVIAVGDATPESGEWCFYATHPPALVWLIGGAFKVFGDHEWAARLVPILASLGTVILLMHLAARRVSRFAAGCAGAAYAVMPMAAYFGRMPDHEAPVLFCMLAALAAWSGMLRRKGQGVDFRRAALWGVWGVAMIAIIWIDWPGFLFAGFFFLHVLAQWRRRLVSGMHVAVVGVVILVASLSMLGYLVFYGLDGRVEDLVAIFQSRSTSSETSNARDMAAQGGLWDFAIGNVTAPLAVAAVVGLIALVVDRRRARPRAGDGLWTVTAVGLVWVAMFPQQFARHNYWMFYLGPAIALLVAIAIDCRLLGDRLRASTAGNVVGCLTMVILLACGVLGTGDYFKRYSFPPDLVEALKRANALCDGQRVVLFRNPLNVEQRGGYRMRNIVPPQWAYYLDCPFDVVPAIEDVPRMAEGHAVFLMPVDDAVQLGERMNVVRRTATFEQSGRMLIFDLRRRDEN